MAERYDLKLEQHASYRLEIDYVEPDTDPAVLVPLGVHRAELQIRKTHASSTALLTLDSDTAGIILSGASLPNIIVRMTENETGALPTNNREVDNWVYDLVVYPLADPDYGKVRIVQGEVLVSPASTR